ncbi:MAG: methyltransferase domain-containing protein [Acidobacteriota bacterium]
MQGHGDPVESSSAAPSRAAVDSPSRDLRTKDFATPDARPMTLLAASEDAEPLPNRRYTSILFWRLVKALDPEAEPARILDLGNTTQANIRFWAERGFLVTCYDLAYHEHKLLEQQPITNLTLAPEKIRERVIPFKDEAFSAICAWNIFARLPFIVARRYVRECYRIMSPTGILHAIFLDAGGRIDCRRRYKVADRQQLDVCSNSPPPNQTADWVGAELAFLFSSFDACETKPAPCQTRELLAQRGPIGRLVVPDRRR